jgi:hypothetical protein
LKSDRDERSPLSVGVSWASRITSLGLEFSLPAVGGYYLDRHFGTAPVATLLGATLGFAIGIMHLVQIARDVKPPNPNL